MNYLNFTIHAQLFIAVIKKQIKIADFFKEKFVLLKLKTVFVSISLHVVFNF